MPGLDKNLMYPGLVADQKSLEGKLPKVYCPQKGKCPMAKKYIVTLEDAEQTGLNTLTRKSRVAVRRLARANILFHDSPTARSGSGGIGRGLDRWSYGRVVPPLYPRFRFLATGVRGLRLRTHGRHRIPAQSQSGLVCYPKTSYALVRVTSDNSTRAPVILVQSVENWKRDNLPSSLFVPC